MSTETSSPFVIEATNSGGGSSELPPAGNHPAVLVAVVDLGTQERVYQGQKSENRMVFLAWELPGEHKSDGSSFVIGQDYNLIPKVSVKTRLRQMLESWRGRPLGDKEKIDLGALLGRPCLINIGHETSKQGTEYARILGVTPPIKGMSIPKPFHDPYIWYFGSRPFDPPDWLPWLYGKSLESWIDDARETQLATAPARNDPIPSAPVNEDADDPPF
jgi:hypothetical protein